MIDKTKLGSVCAFGLLALLLLGLPLLGVGLAGHPIQQYLEFPPMTQYVKHAAFSWPVFVVSVLLTLAVILPFGVRVLLSQRSARAEENGRKPFPWWGWAGLLLNISAWILAWTRFEWFAPCQFYTFAPLWFGLILVVNAWTYSRAGHCLLTHHTHYFLGLFPASAAFWWFFEYLNRFVQNWYYQGGDGLTPLSYFLIASIHFSTVLPAVLSMYELLDSVPGISAGMDKFVKIDIGSPRAVAWAGLAVSGVGLALIGVWPDYLFPLLWLSPLLIITSLQRLGGRSTILSSVRCGSWHRIYLLALAALVCGFFWELWNFRSMAKWIYTVPFVGQFRVFEMPVLGYTGYLPFGLECAVIADMLSGKKQNGKRFF
jgi:hypothetical protein